MSKSREEMRREIAERTKESSERKDKYGKYDDYFKGDISFNKWKVKEAVHVFDIVPYRAGANDPHVEKGKWAYALEVFVHQRIGVNENSYVCPARNYNKPCPICDHQNELRREDDYDKDQVDALEPKRRMVYNVIVYDGGKEEDKGVQIFEVSHWFMEKHLIPLAHDERTKQPISFADPGSDGKSIQFERKGSTKDNTSFIGHKFLDRIIEGESYELSDEDLAAAYCLDELIHIPTEDELYKAYWGEEQEEGGRKEMLDKRYGEDVAGEKEESTSHRRSRRGALVSVEEKEKEELASGDCPGKGQIGVDLDKLDECNKCEVYDNCVAKAEKKETEGKKEPERKKDEEKKEEKGKSPLRRRGR